MMIWDPGIGSWDGRIGDDGLCFLVGLGWWVLGGRRKGFGRKRGGFTRGKLYCLGSDLFYWLGGTRTDRSGFV